MGDLGVTYTVHLWLVGKRLDDFLLVLIELFCQLSRLRRYERIIVEIVVFESGVGHFERKFQGERRRLPPTTYGDRKLEESLRYHVALFCDPTFSRFDTIPACDTHRHTMTANTRASLAPARPCNEVMSNGQNCASSLT